MSGNRMGRLVELKKVATESDWEKVTKAIDSMLDIQTGVSKNQIGARRRPKIKDIITSVFNLPSDQTSDSAKIKTAIKERFDGDEELSFYSKNYTAKQKFEDFLNIAAVYILRQKSPTETDIGTDNNDQKTLATKLSEKYTGAVGYLNKYMDSMDANSANRYVNREFNYKDFYSRLNDAEKKSLETNRANIWDNYVAGLNKLIGDHYKTKVNTGGGTQAASSSSVGGGSTGPVKLSAPQDTVLAEGDYTYKIKSELSFDFSKDKGATWKNVTPRTFSKWDDAAKNLNALYQKNNTATAPATTAPAAATEATKATPAAAAEAAKPAEEGLNQNTIAGVEAVLTRASSKVEWGLGGNTKFTDEKGRINKIVETIGQTKSSGRPLNTLAQILVRENPTTLDRWFASEIKASDVSGANRKDVVANPSGTPLQKAVAAVLDCLNRFYDNSYSRAKDKKTLIENIPRKNEAATEAPATPPAAPATPPATPAPAAATTQEAVPADKADDGAVKLSSRVDPRIKKLSRLRRLRVRSQMEAATESSAQFGRSRIS